MESSYVFNDTEPSFADLPSVIFSNIFQYLNYADIQEASLVCRRWFEVSNYRKFRSNVVIRIRNEVVSDELPPGKVFLNSDRPFPHIYFEKATIGTADNFLSHMGKCAQSVTFESTDITEKQFCAVLAALHGINSLSIVQCSSLFRSELFLESLEDRKTIADTMARIRFLSLKSNEYLSDRILLRITQLISNLEMLDISGSYVFQASSDAKLTFEIETILHVIREHRNSLKELNFSNIRINDDEMSALCGIQCLKLERLLLQLCAGLTPLGIRGYLMAQTNLRFLDLSNALRLTDECLITIVNSLKNIKTLNIECCFQVTNKGALLLAQLSNSLKSLNISKCYGISGDAIGEGIARNPNLKLEELYMSHLNISEDCVMKCGKNLLNLRVLDISECIDGVTDQSVQVLLKNLVYLRVLNMSECRITDAALTGITESSDRSRSQFKLDESKIDGVSIQNLKGLRTLKLSLCPISDVALIYGLKFLELRHLSLSGCKQISVVGLEALVKNCPSIEELDLYYSCEKTEEAVDIVRNNLKRLRVLEIGMA